ncbi:urea ABC transporter ATP-binding subunit UrtE [Thermus antranikianii]|uniref:urea ABC transporter ATP-binding subunit UrtE n=1 Tax=Thermus antranikianii TaxID=88190 RepID=UPI001C744BF8|nr:urea ABC transporter ATP-binding subunit UrtE [Thermus antranikianii]QWK21065.1 MAG: urea ABC transporter ATP-binding subunit UrtE [Thermus antranikianii]
MLEVLDVETGYSDSQVLWGVSLAVDRAEAVALLGRNGVGKTTLLKTILGHLPLKSGRIVYKGRDISRLAPHHRARLGIGYVPQGRGIFPFLTVEENLKTGLAALAGRLHPRAQRIPEAVFELFPILWELRAKRAGALSGGQQQQLAIARALVGLPDLLLLDEPTEGIQPSVVEKIQEALLWIRSELRIALLVVEQNLDFVWGFAQRFYVMDRGQVVMGGKVREANPETVAQMVSL